MLTQGRRHTYRYRRPETSCWPDLEAYPVHGPSFLALIANRPGFNLLSVFRQRNEEVFAKTANTSYAEHNFRKNHSPVLTRNFYESATKIMILDVSLYNQLNAAMDTWADKINPTPLNLPPILDENLLPHRISTRRFFTITVYFLTPPPSPLNKYLFFRSSGMKDYSEEDYDILLAFFSKEVRGILRELAEILREQQAASACINAPILMEKQRDNAVFNSSIPAAPLWPNFRPHTPITPLNIQHPYTLAPLSYIPLYTPAAIETAPAIFRHGFYNPPSNSLQPATLPSTGVPVRLPGPTTALARSGTIPLCLPAPPHQYRPGTRPASPAPKSI